MTLPQVTQLVVGKFTSIIVVSPSDSKLGNTVLKNYPVLFRLSFLITKLYSKRTPFKRSIT